MTPQVPTNETPSADKMTVKRNLFDLDKFSRISVEKEIELKTVDSVDAMNAVADGDESKLVSIFNAGYRRIQISEAKQSMGGDNLVSPKAVSGIVNTLKPLYPAKDDSKAARAEQTQKVYDHIKRTPALLEAAKAIAKAFVDAAIDEDEVDGENESE